uniref:tyrosine-protein phosphatase n=1 Tax=Flavobacterium sp. TaxID=239 RepID=UPI00404907FF
MLSLFKSKPKLSELIPKDYVDIHSHVLPGIDDGAKNLDHTAALLNAMALLGFKKIITTPHTIKNVWNNSRIDIENSLELVKKELPALSNQLDISCASEYFMDENFVEQFQNEKLLPLKDNYVLVEMSYLNAPIQLYDILFNLQLQGYQPVLAHPERYTFFHTNFKEYEKLKKAGCFFQMNLLSSVGYYGKEVASTANKLLANDCINFVGSDIHHLQHVQAFGNKIMLKEVQKLEEAIANNKYFL